MGIVLGPNQYGKAEVRVVAVDRATARHTITDLSVTIALRGEFAGAYLTGDNTHVLTTDTQKNTVFAFARDGIGEIEDFALRLARHFTTEFEPVTGARVEIERYGWDRIPVGGREHDHSFTRAGGEVRTTVVTVQDGQTYVLSGLSGLVVLKTTGSAFRGFPTDRYTTLAETDDRILATAVTARWRHTETVDWADSFAGIRADLLETFATLDSEALQQTLYEMGREVLSGHPELAEIRLSMPNKHHFLQDLSPYGLDNPKVVYHADDRPYGLIQGTVQRDDAPPAGPAWEGTPLYG